MGAFRKGFHACVIEGTTVVAGPKRIGGSPDVVAWLEPHSPSVIAIDSPRSTARPGSTRRDAEAEFSAAKICGIRWTPEEAKLAGNQYYEWIVNGLALYGELATLDSKLIEVFPTASWTRWIGERKPMTRARWTREGLESLDLSGLPDRRLNQDDRDAIAASLTARQFAEAKCQTFKEIVVPIGLHA